MRMSWKTAIKILLIGLGLALVHLMYSLYPFDGYKNAGILSSISNNETKYILYWNLFSIHKIYSAGFGHEPFENCQYKNCYITDQRDILPLEKFDVLIFHVLHYNIEQAPWIRLPHQIYMYMNVEAPVNFCPDLKQYRGYFNWTMTYRFDSDVIRRHQFVIKQETNYIMPSEEFLNKKTKLAAWFVSHCDTSGKRETLTKEIQKHMSVDIYGKCGPLHCDKISAPACYDMVEQNYKFYFSFENSYCRDYATEKLYNILERNIVPVVYGAGDYNISTPPNSVINVADFRNVKELVNYLKYLDRNQDEYLKYFEWKKKYMLVAPIPPTACQICNKLHQPIKQSIYYDIKQWWFGENNSECKTGKALPKIVSDLLEDKNLLLSSIPSKAQKLFNLNSSLIKWFVY